MNLVQNHEQISLLNDCSSYHVVSLEVQNEATLLAFVYEVKAMNLFVHLSLVFNGDGFLMGGSEAGGVKGNQITHFSAPQKLLQVHLEDLHLDFLQIQGLNFYLPYPIVFLVIHWREDQHFFVVEVSDVVGVEELNHTRAIVALAELLFVVLVDQVLQAVQALQLGKQLLNLALVWEPFISFGLPLLLDYRVQVFVEVFLHG